MSDRIFKLVELVVYKHYFECCDDQTGEIETYQEFRGIGIIIDKYAIEVPKSGCLIINNAGNRDNIRIINKYMHKPIRKNI